MQQVIRVAGEGNLMSSSPATQLALSDAGKHAIRADACGLTAAVLGSNPEGAGHRGVTCLLAEVAGLEGTVVVHRADKACAVTLLATYLQDAHLDFFNAEPHGLNISVDSEKLSASDTLCCTSLLQQTWKLRGK